VQFNSTTKAIRCKRNSHDQYRESVSRRAARGTTLQSILTGRPACAGKRLANRLRSCADDSCQTDTMRRAISKCAGKRTPRLLAIYKPSSRRHAELPLFHLRTRSLCIFVSLLQTPQYATEPPLVTERPRRELTRYCQRPRHHNT
jgi:hypothetical protein